MAKRKSTSSESTPRLDGRGFPGYHAVCACLRTPVFIYNGARKIVRNVSFTLDSVPDTDLEAVGYSPRHKLKALDRMYYNEVEAERIRQLLTRRSDQAFSALAYSFRAGAKDSRSMGHCMESMVIGLTPDRCEVEVFYRSTEVIKKHSADLAFLPIVFERLGIKPQLVTFTFAYAYLSGVFFPTLFRFWDPFDFLADIKEREPKLYQVATRFIRRSVRTVDHKFPYAPERQQHEYAWKHYPEKMPRINQFLEENP